MYTEIGTSTYTKAAETRADMFMHTEPHKHVCACTRTQRMQIEKGQAKPRVGGRGSDHRDKPDHAHPACMCSYTHTHPGGNHFLHRSFWIQGNMQSGPHAWKESAFVCWEQGFGSSCSNSRIRARPIPCPREEGQAGPGWGGLGVGLPAGPAPALGHCLWQAAQGPESHSDPRPWSGLASAPRPGTTLTQTEAWPWPWAPRPPHASGLAFFLPLQSEKKGQALELE